MVDKAARPAPPALEAELARFGPRVRQFARRHLPDPAAADDLAQEVLLIVLQALRAGRVEHPERLGAFVLGTCRLALRDAQRGSHRRATLLERFGGDLVPAEPPAPTVDGTKLERCLAKLGEQDRAVLMLTFYAERSAAEIATELGLSAGNVRVTRHRALTRLHDCVRGTEERAP
jgi:RNA polymerase sigma-70 factor (ECF subfamily)